MSAKSWIGIGSGSWADDANWLPSGAPAAGDDATITGPAITFGQSPDVQTITGPGNAHSLALLGNTALAGTVTTGVLQVGRADTVGGGIAGGLSVVPGGAVTAAALDVNVGSVGASGAGASLNVSGALYLGSSNGPGLVSLKAERGGAIQAAAFVFQNIDPALTTVIVDDLSTVEVGTAGGAAAGQLTIDPGNDLRASGSVSASKGIINGGVLSTSGTLSLYGNVTGAGSLQVGAGAVLNLRGTTDVTTENVTFTGFGGQLGIISYSTAPASPYASNLAGAITGFAAGDVIAVSQGVVGTVTATYTATGLGKGILDLSYGTTDLAVLTLVGDYAGMLFSVTPARTVSGEVSEVTVAAAPPAPAPVPIPMPVPVPPPPTTPVTNIAGFQAAYLPRSNYSASAIAAAGAGLASLITPPYVVAVSTSSTGAFDAPAANSLNIAVALAPGASLALPAEYGSLLAQGNNAVTLSDAGVAGTVLIGNVGNDTFNSTGAGVTLVGGQGANTFNVSGSATVVTGDGPGTVRGSGNAALTVTTGTGGSTVVLAGGTGIVNSNGQDTVFGGTGVSRVTATTGMVAVGGAGRMTFIGGSAPSFVFGGTGGVNYTAGSAYDVVVGIGGPLTAQGGAGGGQFWGNSGGDVLRAGTGQTVLYGTGGDKLYSAGRAGNVLVAGDGDVLLDGSAAKGNDAFFGGSKGHDTIIAGSGNDLIGTGSGTSTVQLGAGYDTVFAFGASTITAGSGGADLVFGGTAQLVINAGGARSFDLFNFVPGAERIVLQGYESGAVANALATQANGAGNTLLTLSDHTAINLVGVARADMSFFG